MWAAPSPRPPRVGVTRGPVPLLSRRRRPAPGRWRPSPWCGGWRWLRCWRPTQPRRPLALPSCVGRRTHGASRNLGWAAAATLRHPSGTGGMTRSADGKRDAAVADRHGRCGGAYGDDGGRGGEAERGRGWVGGRPRVTSGRGGGGGRRVGAVGARCGGPTELRRRRVGAAHRDGGRPVADAPPSPLPATRAWQPWPGSGIEMTWRCECPAVRGGWRWRSPCRLPRRRDGRIARRG